MGIDEGWIIRPLVGGEPPPCRALSRESSVPLEAWLTESQRETTLTAMIHTYTETCLQVDGHLVNYRHAPFLQFLLLCTYL